MLSNMTDMLASIALNIQEEGAAIVVRACNPALAPGFMGTILNPVGVEPNAAAGGSISLIPTNIARVAGATTPMFAVYILIKPIDGGGNLDLREPAVKTTNTWGGNITESGHCILMNARCKAM
jgi:hypothetical protein